MKSVNLTFMSRRVHTGGFMVDDMRGLVLTPRIGGVKYLVWGGEWVHQEVE